MNLTGWGMSPSQALLATQCSAWSADEGATSSTIGDDVCRQPIFSTTNLSFWQLRFMHCKTTCDEAASLWAEGGMAIMHACTSDAHGRMHVVASRYCRWYARSPASLRQRAISTVWYRLHHAFSGMMHTESESICVYQACENIYMIRLLR